MNSNIINQSNLISRDLSWLNFNYRVLWVDLVTTEEMKLPFL